MGKHSLEEQFQAAVEIIQNLPKKGPMQPSVSEKLETYGLFKQATKGPCREEDMPAFYQVEARLKWNAWKALADMSKDEAMARYIELFMEKIDKAESEHDVMDFLSDPQYEEYLHMEPMFRKNFAILGRTSVKGHEGETLKVNGTNIQL